MVLPRRVLKHLTQTRHLLCYNEQIDFNSRSTSNQIQTTIASKKLLVVKGTVSILSSQFDSSIVF